MVVIKEIAQRSGSRLIIDGFGVAAIAVMLGVMLHLPVLL